MMYFRMCPLVFNVHIVRRIMIIIATIGTSRTALVACAFLHLHL